LISVDLPEPDTPVTQVEHLAAGIVTSRWRRLFPLASTMVDARSAALAPLARHRDRFQARQVAARERCGFGGDLSGRP